MGDDLLRLQLAAEARRVARRDFLLRAGLSAGAAALGALLGTRVARAACSSIDALPSVGPAFPGGLETRDGINIGYYPFRVCAPAGGTWLYSGDHGAGAAGRRLAWLRNGTEFSTQSVPNSGRCSGGGNCASDSPPMPPPAAGSWCWGYGERFPGVGLGSPPAPTQDQGWVDAAHLEFVGYLPHTLRTGPACRDFEVRTNPSDGRLVAPNGQPNTRCGIPNPTCDAVNRCGEGETDCRSDYGATDNHGEGSRLRSTCLGGYEFSPLVPDDNSPDMPRGAPMPVSYLFFAPRSNTKAYLHAGDVVKVMWRRTMLIGHASGGDTRSSWYGVEVVRSQCPTLTPVGVRGWVMAFSEWDQRESGRGAFFSEAT